MSPFSKYTLLPLAVLQFSSMYRLLHKLYYVDVVYAGIIYSASIATRDKSAAIMHLYSVEFL